LSDGGLLQKALDQQANDLVAEVADSREKKPSGAGLAAAFVAISVFAILPLTLTFLFVMWTPFHLPWLMPAVAMTSVVVVWWRLGIGLPDFMGGEGINQTLATLVTASFAVVLAGPVILGLVLEGDLSLGEIEYSEDGEQITMKLRQNSLTGTDAEASFSIQQSDKTLLSGAESVSIDKQDSLGDYGSFTLHISSFFSENALPSNAYTITVTVKGQGEWTRDLDSIVMSRNVTSAEGSAAGVVKDDSDCSGDVENCLVGVVLTGWAGLMGSSGKKPGGLPYADYSLQATLMEGNSIAVQFPVVSVVNSAATWDSNGGDFGSGKAIAGSELATSELRLDGSVLEPTFGDRSYVPRADFDSSGDYGCYSFVVDVSQDQDALILSHISYYEYTTSNGNDLWTDVGQC